MRMLPATARVVLPLGQLEVVERHAAIFGARVAQEERRMERRDQHGIAERVQASAQLADRLLRLQERLRRDRAEREDHLRLDDAELRIEERTARGELVRLGVPVAGGPAKDGVRNKAFVARDVD